MGCRTIAQGKGGERLFFYEEERGGPEKKFCFYVGFSREANFTRNSL